MATLIKTDGTQNEIIPQNTHDFQLDELQAAVHGYIELLYLPNTKKVMVLNEEGKFHCSANIKATKLTQKHGALRSGDFICGDVVICNSWEVQ